MCVHWLGLRLGLGLRLRLGLGLGLKLSAFVDLPQLPTKLWQWALLRSRTWKKYLLGFAATSAETRVGVGLLSPSTDLPWLRRALGQRARVLFCVAWWQHPLGDCLEGLRTLSPFHCCNTARHVLASLVPA